MKKRVATIIIILALWWVGVIPTIIGSIEGGFYDLSVHFGNADTDEYYTKVYEILDGIKENSLRAFYPTRYTGFMYRHGGLAYYLIVTNKGITICDYILNRMDTENIDRPKDKTKIESYKKNIEDHVVYMRNQYPSMWQEIIFSSTLKV